ncbi:hypothetical protein EDB89DRAFT_1479684 [Lactarius sanguifluus]|nr:hypothetical protein EDB89DRAFT_1479684 [Lactarius sanguifluus]
MRGSVSASSNSCSGGKKEPRSVQRLVTREIVDVRGEHRRPGGEENDRSRQCVRAGASGHPPPPSRPRWTIEGHMMVTHGRPGTGSPSGSPSAVSVSASGRSSSLFEVTGAFAVYVLETVIGKVRVRPLTVACPARSCDKKESGMWENALSSSFMHGAVIFGSRPCPRVCARCPTLSTGVQPSKTPHAGQSSSSNHHGDYFVVRLERGSQMKWSIPI